MKRPLAVIGFSYLAALRVAFILGIEYAPVLAAVSLAAGVCAVIIRRLRTDGKMPCIFFGAAAALVVLSIFTSVCVTPNQSLYSASGRIDSTLVDLPYEQNGRYYYKLKIDSAGIPDAKPGATALVSSKTRLDVQPYDEIGADVSFYEKPSDSYLNYGISRGIQVRGSIDPRGEISIRKAESRPVMYYVLKVKSRLLSAISSMMPEKEAAIVSAMLLNDKFSISSEDMQSFRAAGVSHIIVVSGFHVAVLTSLISMLLGLFIKNRRAVSVLCCGAVVFFMSLTGFTPSIMRAGIMQISVLLAVVFSRQSDRLNALGLATIVICLLNPYSGADVGFLLSFYATLGIIVLSPRMYSYLMERLQAKKTDKSAALSRTKRAAATVGRYFLSVFCVTVSAVLFTAPCSIMNFKGFALYSVPFNLLISPVASLLISCGVIMAVLSLLPFVSFLALPFAFVCRLSADYIIAVSGVTSLLPYSYITAAQDYIPACLLLSVGVTGLLLCLKNKRLMFALSAALTAVIFLCGAVFSGIGNIGSEKVSVVDTGDGLSVVLQGSDGSASVLFCGGDRGKGNVMSDYLGNSGIGNITYMLITDQSFRDTGYAADIMSGHSVGCVHVYDRQRVSEKLSAALDFAGSIISSDYRDKKEVLAHAGQSDIYVMRCYNCTSVYFSCGGRTFLIVGDKTDCSIIPEKNRSSDYLIINGNVENLQLLHCREAIISGDEENAAQLRQKLSSSCDSCCVTGGRGSICVRVRSDGSAALRREGLWLS